MESVIKDSGERRLLPPFTAEHEELRATIRRWVEGEVAPHVDEWDAAQEFARALRASGRARLQVKYPVSLGGREATTCTTPCGRRSSRRRAPGAGSARPRAHTGIATPPVWKFGTSDQHERFLRPAIAGEKIAALGITEPGAGSDVASIRTSAKKVPGGYVVNGAKTFITNGVRADFLVCAVKTSGAGGHHGISFLLLERDMPGYEVSRKLEKMGWLASDTGELAFTDVEVPDENLSARRTARLLPDHGQLPMGAPPHGARRRRGDEQAAR